MSQTVELFSDSEDAVGPGVTQKIQTPSKYAGEDIDLYLSEKTELLEMRTRKRDPFGLFQDVKRKEIEIQKAPTRKVQVKRAPAKPLAEIVKRIEITAVIPRRKEFLVANRSFRQGDTFPLEFDRKKVTVKIVSVGSKKIVFENVKTGERAARPNDILPPGLQPGADQKIPPGMVSDDSNAPLKLSTK